MANFLIDKVTAEFITSLPGQGGHLFRIRAPGGWIVVGSVMCADINGNVATMSMAFVPDAEHAWLAEEDSNE